MLFMKICWRCINVQSEKDGRYIEKVKFNKSHITIIFSNGESLKVSESTYSHFYLYKEKKLSDDEYQEIVNYENLNKAREYVLNLVSKGSYTEKDIYERLIIKKSLPKEDASKIVSYLKERNLINDNDYIYEYVDLLNLRSYGKNKIIQKCYEEGFNKELIDKLSFDDELEKEKAEVQLRKYIVAKNKNYQKLKENAYSFLINQGFDFEICSSTIKIIDEEYDFSKEKELLKKELKKYLISHSIDLDDFEQKSKLINSFIRKGYRYEDIKKEIRGVEDEIY